ncbi:serine/threonine-protein kinase mig-15-like [Xenopus laevis]|uniref:Serine/threonine-protein kinase mig-15-like n=1 Tax=Xenopus laevis TaxID=8355 RepID=A0A8J1M888_XENLA|nr:serine/threonine-protein kinase mig-15-like [Xenopus laevis]
MMELLSLLLFQGWHIDLQKEVAIKIINDPENEKYQEEELEILRKVTGHRNVIKFYGAFYHRAPRRSTPNKGLSISMELCTGGTIRDLMSGRKNNSLGEKWTAYICKEVIKGLCPPRDSGSHPIMTSSPSI